VINIMHTIPVNGCKVQSPSANVHDLQGSIVGGRPTFDWKVHHIQGGIGRESAWET
jgi:hypothetical protein